MIDIDDTYRKILDNLDDGVYFVDRDRRILYWNKGAERITGFSAAKVQGHFCQDNILNHITENGTPLCKDGCPLHATIMDGKSRQAEIFLHHAEGHRVPIVVRTTPMRDEHGEIIGAVETFSDNTKLISIRHQVRRLQDAALRDPLTGIWNRRFMDQRLETAMWEFQNQEISFGALFMDIDDFKVVNDTYGHKVGDQVLSMIANTLYKNLRADDVVARWGGEEFVALLRGLDLHGVHSVAEKLRTLVEHSSLRFRNQNVSVTISIGMTLARKEDSVKSLIDRADRNMYISKKLGNNRTSGDPQTP